MRRRRRNRNGMGIQHTASGDAKIRHAMSRRTFPHAPRATCVVVYLPRLIESRPAVPSLRWRPSGGRWRPSGGRRRTSGGRWRPSALWCCPSGALYRPSRGGCTTGKAGCRAFARARQRIGRVACKGVRRQVGRDACKDARQHHGGDAWG